MPIDYSDFDWQGKNYVKIIGRTLSGKRVCVIDDYEASFWAILQPKVKEKKIQEIIEKISKIKVKNPSRTSSVLKTELCNKKFLGKSVRAIKISVTNHKDMHGIADQLGMKEIYKRREYDISLISKYVMQGGIEPLCWYRINGENIDNSDDFGGIGKALDVDFCLKIEGKEKSKEQPEFKPKILAYDIEVSDIELGKGEILMISLYGKNFKKVLTWKKCNKKQDFVECFKDEEEMIEAFVKSVKEYQPDILTGYFSDGFDLPYLRANAHQNKVKLALGIDGSQPVFSRGRLVSGKISGIVHLDLYRFISSVYFQYLQSETLGLNDIASELLGEKKDDFDFLKLKNMKEQDWKDFFAYNLQDSVITYKLAEKLWPDILEFTKIMKQPLFNVSRNSMSSHVEDYILQNLSGFDEIAEKRPLHEEIGKRRERPKYVGAFVFQPKPGLYENLCFFDFTSMYASVIVSYNLSLSTFESIKEKKPVFSKQKGFFPKMLEEIIEKRKKYKQEYNKNKNPVTKARSNAYKLLANAAYGYQGFFGARYYCVEAAAATASYAKENILTAIDKIKKKGYEIIYSDTDSIAFLLGKNTKKTVLEMLKEINLKLPGIMELELEDFYKRGLFVSKRSIEKGKTREDSGAKKKYALIDEKDKMKIRGFETVRRDWCKLSRELQNKVLQNILKKGNEKSALELIKETIKEIKARQIDKNQLMIRTQLKKPINEYVSKGPHVIAAQKMEDAGLAVSQGMLIEYYLAENKSSKSKLVRDKVKLPDESGEYDIDYYLNNQILPAVGNILEVFDIDVEKEFIKDHRQKGLGDF